MKAGTSETETFIAGTCSAEALETVIFEIRSETLIADMFKAEAFQDDIHGMHMIYTVIGLLAFGRFFFFFSGVGGGIICALFLLMFAILYKVTTHACEYPKHDTK